MAKSTRTPTACVVIPCYQSTLRPFEELALQQCRRVLARHDTIIVKPHSLDLSALCERHGIERVESFDDAFFNGVSGYNRLMLSDGFYARFATYDYLLIHQLDAFVFRDELIAWCEAGHDYIGPPWLPPRPTPPTRLDELYIKARQYAYRWADIQDPAAKGAHKGQYMYAVGNGGFSLRRIAAMRATLAALSPRVQAYGRDDGRVHHEDIFFAIEANRYLPRVKVPSFREAVGFAWETQPAQARALNRGQLPFGCHAWNKLHRDEWRPVFAELGHSLDELLR